MQTDPRRRPGGSSNTAAPESRFDEPLSRNRSGIPRRPSNVQNVEPPRKEEMTARSANRVSRSEQHHIPATQQPLDTRPTAQAMSRLNMQYENTRGPIRLATPALTTISTASSSGATHSVLRRKPSIIGRQVQRRSTDTRGNQAQDDIIHVAHDEDDDFDGTVLGISMPPPLKSKHVDRFPSTNTPQPAVLNRQVLDNSKITAPSGLGHYRPNSLTPSSRYSDSPFSHMSSPTSASSYSPHTSVNYSTTPASSNRKGPPLPSSPKAFMNSARTSMSPRASAGSADFKQVLNPKEVARPIPPELAHLNTDSVPSPKSVRPRRPSRDGTPDLSDLQRPFPVIHSDLPASITTYHKRMPSYEATITAENTAEARPRRRFGFRSRSSSREPDTRKDSMVSPPPSDINMKTATSRTNLAQAFSRRPSPSIAPSPSPTPSSTFGDFHFGRSVNKLSKPAKKLRKGPVAGTGHEGYGKWFRGRTSSTISASSSTRSDSADSMSSEKSSFWGRRRAKTPTQEEPAQDVNSADGTFSADHGYSVQVTSAMPTPAVPDQKPWADHKDFAKAGLLSHHQVTHPGGTGDERLRSVRKSQTMGELSSHQKAVDDLAPSPPDSYSKKPNTFMRSEIREGDWLKSDNRTGFQSLGKTFLQRARGAALLSKKSLNELPSKNIQTQTNAQRLGPLIEPHENDRVDMQDIQRLVSNESNSTLGEASIRDSMRPVIYQARHVSMLPTLGGATDSKSVKHDSLTRSPLLRTESGDSATVMSARTAQATLAPRMVDIPRSPRTSDIDVPHSRGLSKVSRLSSIKPKIDSPRLPSTASAKQSDDHKSTTSNVQPFDTGRTHTGNGSESFIAFPERKNSELSYTSSSAASFRTDSTLIAHSGQTFWMGDEDVWNEYNDLLDDVMEMPPQTARSIGSSLGAPFQYDGAERPGSKATPRIPDLVEEVPTPLDPVPDETDESYRFSRLLQPIAEPSTPYSISDIMAGYSDFSGNSSRTRQSIPPPNRSSAESGYSSHYSRHSGMHSRTASRPEAGIVPPLPLVPKKAADDKSANQDRSKRDSVRKSADADLRFGALMTTKWLQFGRLLFSPAEKEIKRSHDARILIVDGLGKDWSYYCALTYPNATFYNLDIDKTRTTTPSNKGQDLKNYRNVHHASLSSPFPFPRGFFTAVILRFPIVTTEKAYQACIFECKRVLRAGGFLEISVLDLDLTNMGNNVRRALRTLKTNISEADNQTSLRNLGDTMMTLVGRRGFENIQRCVVGLPAAGRIPRSHDYSSSDSERSSLQAAISAHEKSKHQTKDGNFANLIYGNSTDAAPGSREKDEGITKMVARVSRYWFSSCYESASASSTSIWDQPGILRQCEKQGTSFRLLLCYAQKPTCAVRRTASV